MCSPSLLMRRGVVGDFVAARRCFETFLESPGRRRLEPVAAKLVEFCKAVSAVLVVVLVGTNAAWCSDPSLTNRSVQLTQRAG